MSTGRIVVVGGGVSGLAAAASLARAGCAVTLVEASPRLGGQVHTVRREGWILEAGALLVAEPAPEVRSLLDEVGLAEETVRAAAASRRRYVVHRGVPQPIPATLSDLIASPLLSLAGRLRMAREPFIPPRTTSDDETVEAFARRRFGDEVAERLFDSLVAEMSAGDASQTLVRYLFPRLVEFEESKGSVLKGQMRAGMEMRRRMRGKPQGAWSCREGLDGLIRALANQPQLRAIVDTAVLAIEQGLDGLRVRTASGGEEFDQVILALPASALGRLELPGEWRAEMGAVAGVPSASVASVSLGFPRAAVAHPLDGLSIRVPTHEQRPLLTVIVPTAAFPDRAPADHHLVTCLVGGVNHPEVTALPAPEMLALVREQLAELIGCTAQPVISEITSWPEAFPQAVAGHGERLRAAERLEAAEPRLSMIGPWRNGIAVSDLLRSGVRATDEVLARQQKS